MVDFWWIVILQPQQNTILLQSYATHHHFSVCGAQRASDNQHILWGKRFEVQTNVGNVELRKLSQFLSLQDFSVSLTYSYILQLLKACVLTHTSVYVGRGGIYAIIPQLMIRKPYCSRASPQSTVPQNILWQILRFTENRHYWVSFLIFNIKQFLQDTVFIKVLITGEREKA